MGITVNKVLADKVFISKEKTVQSGFILMNTTPTYRVEKVSDTLQNYINVEINEGDRVIINNRAGQFVYSDNGVEYYFVHAGDILCKIEDGD